MEKERATLTVTCCCKQLSARAETDDIDDTRVAGEGGEVLDTWWMGGNGR